MAVPCLGIVAGKIFDGYLILNGCKNLSCLLSIQCPFDCFDDIDLYFVSFYVVISYAGHICYLKSKLCQCQNLPAMYCRLKRLLKKCTGAMEAENYFSLYR